MLYNANVILNEFLYRKCLLFGVYTYFTLLKNLSLGILQNWRNKD